jgi:hypothetical protein
MSAPWLRARLAAGLVAVVMALSLSGRVPRAELELEPGLRLRRWLGLGRGQGLQRDTAAARSEDDAGLLPDCARIGRDRRVEHATYPHTLSDHGLLAPEQLGRDTSANPLLQPVA